MFAPATRPWSMCSAPGAGPRSSAAAVRVATAFAEFCRATPVACPVATTASRLNTSGSSVTSTALSAAGTATCLRRKPMRRIASVTSPAGAPTVKRPSSPVRAAIVVPTTATVAPTTASPVVADVTRPVIWRCWAVALAAPKLRASARETRQERVLTVPPWLCAVMGPACDLAAGATLQAVWRTRKEGERRRGCWKNSGGRCGLELRAPPRRVAQRPHRRQQHRDGDAGQPDRVALHLERHRGDEQQHRQQGEAREHRQPDRHPERAAQLGLPAAAIQAPSQGPTSLAASAGQAPSVQWRQSVSASTGTIVTR